MRCPIDRLDAASTIIFDQPSPAALARHLATLLTDVATQAVSITRPAGCIDEPWQWWDGLPVSR